MTRCIFNLCLLGLPVSCLYLPLLPLVAAAEATRTMRMASDPALSPDGELLALSWGGEIWTVPINGGDAKRLTHHLANDTQPKISPDGKSLAFVSDRTGSNQIFVIPLAGGIAEQKTFHSEGYQLADWFPDGQSILAIGRRDHFWKYNDRLIQIDLTKRTAEKILADAFASTASISHDGHRILFNREGERSWRKGYQGERAAQVWELDLKTNQFTEVLHEGVDCRWPLWMPNDKGFYFTKGDIHGFDLWRYRFPNAKEEEKVGQQKRVAGFPEDSIVEPTISRDGSVVVFRHLFDFYSLNPRERNEPEKIEIRLDEDIELPVDQLRQTYTKAERVAFTDDGLEIAFVAGGDLWLMDAEFREPVRVTHTDGVESDPIFAPDGKSLWFTRMIDGQIDIWKVERKKSDAFWWQQNEFTETQITRTPSTEFDLKFTPDGTQLLFQIAFGDLMRFDLKSEATETIYDGFAEVDYAISPDSRWIAYSARDEYFNSEVWLMPIDGSQLPTNVSRHPDNDVGPVFSPDGKLLAYTGTRGDDEVDVYYVYLQESLAEQTSRERRLQKAVETIKKKRDAAAKSASSSRSTSNAKSEEPSSSSDDSDSDSKTSKTSSNSESAPRRMVVDLEDIHKRVRKISIPNSSERNLLFSSDAKRLAFEATMDGKRGLYAVEFPDQLQPKLLSTTALDNSRWTKAANGILGSNQGVPAKLEGGEKLQSYSFTARHERSLAGRFREGFNAAWLTMRDTWYDPKMAKRNWDSIRRKYEEVASEAHDERELGAIVEMMLGELNGSHLGFTPSIATAREVTETRTWTAQTAHLGVRLDGSYRGPGLRVRDVLPDGPADRHESHLFPGDIILSIDDVTVDPDLDLTSVLNGVLERDIRLVVQRSKATKKANDKSTNESDDDSQSNEKKIEAKPTIQKAEVTIRPISYARASLLLYEHWLAHNREMVDKQSDGKLGYLHIKSMDEASFFEFETQLYQVGYGRDGLVIDVRDNGGGSTTDLLLTALTQPRHAITVPRGGSQGYPQDRLVFASWSKPIVVLCNQNSYSNAEIFSHAIKTLGRGKVIGVRTAGGVVTTSSARVTDVGIIRVPYRGWFSLASGKDMELNGAEPDIVIWPAPDELPQGIDRQLEQAVKSLLEDVAKMPIPPEIEYATER
ncbi:MAG: S41 family peptidase [Pirellulaceae bacterium]|nr:S41 family peptidase [Pirellulaceae bacterium]